MIVRLRGRSLARAAHAALRIGNDAVRQIHNPRRHQRPHAPESPTSHSIPDSPPASPSAISAAMQLRHSVHGLRLRRHAQHPSLHLQTRTPRDSSHPSAATRRSGRSRACHASAPRAPTRATAHAELPETAPPRRDPSAAPTRRAQPSATGCRCYPQAADESPRAELRPAPHPSHPRARQTPAACPSAGDDAAAAAPVPHRRIPSHPQPRFAPPSS